jgi:FtsP/CotA-like multicopper oxidase with cupredoxin domain
VTITRRQLLAGTAMGTLACVLPALTRAETAADGHTVLKTQVLPKLLMENGERTKLWAYNAINPGPEIRVKRHDQVKVRLVNGLDEPTMIHWHGIRIDNAMDGSPLTQNPVRSGETFDYEFAAPDAGTYWYHPHLDASKQVERGLYGALIVEEETPPADTEDMVLLLDDWLVNDDGTLNEAAFGDIRIAAHGGRMGNWFTVNGKSRPHMQAPAAKRLRLRLINCANARIMNIQIKGAAPVIIALDGQPLPTPREVGTDALQLGPGARADLIIRGSAEDIVIANVNAANEPLEVAYISRTGEAGETDTAAIDPLSSNGLPDTIDITGVTPRELVMEGGVHGGMKSAKLRGQDMDMRQLVQNGMAWSFNGVAGMTEEPLATVKLGETVVIDFINKTGWPHAMHLHGHHMKLLQADGKQATHQDWRDTLVMAANSKVQVAFIADNPGKWMLHCHMLEHQESGMMTWLAVES